MRVLLWLPIQVTGLTGLDKVSVGNTLGPSVVELNSYRRQHTAVINNHGGAPKVRLRMIVPGK